MAAEQIRIAWMCPNELVNANNRIYRNDCGQPNESNVNLAMVSFAFVHFYTRKKSVKLRLLGDVYWNNKMCRLFNPILFSMTFRSVFDGPIDQSSVPRMYCILCGNNNRCVKWHWLARMEKVNLIRTTHLSMTKRNENTEFILKKWRAFNVQFNFISLLEFISVFTCWFFYDE